MHSTLAKRLAPAVGVLVVLALQAFPVSPASAGAEAGTATRVDAGGYHSCAITPAERLKCWGYNSYGELGLGDNLEHQFKPRLVPGLENVKKVATGSYNTCAIVGGAGKLKCWGDGDYGMVGDGTNDMRPSPVVTIESGVKQVDIGEYHACAVLKSGKAKCWGVNTYGEIGDGTTDTRLKPRLVERLKNVANISAGGNYTCATTASGKAKCWGYNDYGVIGDGTEEDRKRPTQVLGLDKNVKVVKAGYYTTCAIIGDGRLKCWGNNSNGEVGNGVFGGEYTEPVQVVGMESGVKSVDPDYYFTCALKGDTAKCFGWNTYGQLGTDDENDRNEPTTVKTLKDNVVQVTTAWYHACALLKSGATKCWGTNTEGQVGNDSDGTDEWLTPQRVLL